MLLFNGQCRILTILSQEQREYVMEKINVSVCAIYPDVEIPKYQTSGSAGCDVKAYLLPLNGIEIKPQQTVLIPIGLKFSVPDGYEMQIRPRSGLSLKTKLRIANATGTLDSDYRGELGVILENTSIDILDGVS